MGELSSGRSSLYVSMMQIAEGIKFVEASCGT